MAAPGGLAELLDGGDFECHICTGVFEDPVVTADGHSCAREGGKDMNKRDGT